MFVFYDIATPA
jgi:hypothetical protein